MVATILLIAEEMILEVFFALLAELLSFEASGFSAEFVGFGILVDDVKS